MKPFKDIIIINTKYKGIEYTEGTQTFKLVGVYIDLLPDNISNGHALGIIRFKDKYYLLDDNIGYAVDIDKYIIAFTGYNFVMKYTYEGTIYFFEDVRIYSAKNKPFRKLKTFSQTDKAKQIFQYMRT